MGKKKGDKKAEKKETVPLGEYLQDTKPTNSWADDDSEFTKMETRTSTYVASGPPKPSTEEETSSNWRARKPDSDESRANTRPSVVSSTDYRGEHHRGYGDYRDDGNNERRGDYRGDYRDDGNNEHRERRGDYRAGYGGEHRERRGDGGDYRSEHRGFGDYRRERHQVPFPTEAPFTAFVGSLSRDVEESDLRELFEQCNIKEIRPIFDRNCAYVEFYEADDLKKALEFDGHELHQNRLRVNIAEKRDRPRRGGDFGPRDQRERPPPKEERDLPDNWREKDGRDIPAVFTRTHRDNPRHDHNDAPIGREKPRERPKLDLKPRTTDSATLEQATYVKSNPFGNAKPRDENEIMRKKEEERKQRDQTRSNTSEKKKPEEKKSEEKKFEEKKSEEKKSEEKKRPEQAKPKEHVVQKQPQKDVPENEPTKLAKPQTQPAKPQTQPEKSQTQPEKPQAQSAKQSGEPAKKTAPSKEDDGWTPVSGKKKRHNEKAK